MKNQITRVRLIQLDHLEPVIGTERNGYAVQSSKSSPFDCFSVGLIIDDLTLAVGYQNIDYLVSCGPV